MAKRNQRVLEGAERDAVIARVSEYVELSVTPFGKSQRGVVRVDERPSMYAGEGTVYLLQMFAEGELVNNRIGAWMVLFDKGVSAGFHTHGSRREQELYVIVHGKGVYRDKDGSGGTVREQVVRKGSITSVQGRGFHSIENTSDEPLIIFVVTTNEPEGV